MNTSGSNSHPLSGRTALVTGSSRGIGLGIARSLARAGATVVLHGRDADRLPAAVQDQIADGYPLRRLGTVDDLGAAAVFLAGDASAWVTGAVLDVAGGSSVV